MPESAPREAAPREAAAPEAAIREAAAPVAAVPEAVPPEGAPPPRRRPRRRRLLVALAVAAALVAVDSARPPEAQVTTRAALAALGAYQATLSPLFGALGLECRFQPTCSRYAVGAVRKDGAVIGSLRAAWRLLRCAPWTPAGTVDPP